MNTPLDIKKDIADPQTKIGSTVQKYRDMVAKWESEDRRRKAERMARRKNLKTTLNQP